MERDTSRSLFVELLTCLILTGVLFISFPLSPAFAALTCSVTTAAACTSPAVVVYRMSATSNAHAELPSGTTPAYDANVMCCTGVTGLGNSCSGNFGTVLKLQATTNSHVGINTSSYTNPVCLSISSGTVTISYASSGVNTCSAGLTVVGSSDANTTGSPDNAHVYGTSPAFGSAAICASVVSNSLTFTTDSGTETLPNLSPGTLVATTSILTTNTGNATGFNVTVIRTNAAATLLRTGDTTVTFPDKTAWSAPAATTTTSAATASTTQAQTLQFRIRSAGTDTPNYASAWWGTDDTTVNARFAGFPVTAQTIINRSTIASTDTFARVLYNVDAPVTQKSGAYTGDVTYSATANP